MDATEEDRAWIKEMAKLGDFNAIEAQFGERWVAKARRYLDKKATQVDAQADEPTENEPSTVRKIVSQSAGSFLPDASDLGRLGEVVAYSDVDDRKIIASNEAYDVGDAMEQELAAPVVTKVSVAKKKKLTPSKSTEQAGASAGVDEDGSSVAPTLKVKKVKPAGAEGAAPKVKKAPSAYNIFFSENHRSVEGPGGEKLAFHERARVLADQWKTFGAEDKAPYVEAAEQAKASLEGQAAGDGSVTASKSKPKPKSKSKVEPTFVDGDEAAEGEGAGFAVTTSASKVLEKKAGKKTRRAVKEEGDEADSDEEEVPIAGASGVPDASTKAKTKQHGQGYRKRVRRDEEEEEADSDGHHTDEDDVILVRDPRGEALRAAAARKASGAGVSIKNGYIIEQGASADVLPRMTGKFNYKRYTPVLGESAALVLPAYAEWRAAVSAAAAELGPGSTAARAQQVLLLLQANGRITTGLEHAVDGCTTGVLLGRVESLERLAEPAVSTAVEANSTFGASSSNAGASEADDPFDDGGSISSSQPGTSVFGTSAPPRPGRSQWYLLTLRMSKSASVRGDFALQAQGTMEEGEEGAQSSACAGAGDEMDVDSLAQGASSSKSAVWGGDDLDGPIISIPWLAPQDSLVKDYFVLTGSAYSESLAIELKPGTQVRALMALPGSNGTSSSQGEWLEGRVYDAAPRKCYKEQGWTACPYASLSIMWYSQLAEDPSVWFLEEYQTSGRMCPWEVTTKNLPFVAACNVHHFALPTPAFTTPVDVIDFVSTMESAVPFLDPVHKKEVYAAAYYARIKSPMDLSTMRKKYKDGQYGAGAGGVHALWEDMRTMIKNAKMFNTPDSLVWCQADELQAQVRRLKSKYAGQTGAGTGAVSSLALRPSSVPVHSKALSHSQLDDDVSLFGSQLQEDIDAELQAELGGEEGAQSSSAVALESERRAERSLKAHAARPPMSLGSTLATLRSTVAVRLEAGEEDELDMDMGCSQRSTGSDL